MKKKAIALSISLIYSGLISISNPVLAQTEAKTKEIKINKIKASELKPRTTVP